MPRGQEAPERLLVDRFHLAAQGCERRAPQPSQHVGVAPFALDAARPQLAANQLLGLLELDQHIPDVTPEALVRLSGRERAVTLRVAQHELAQRLGAALEEHVGETGRRHHPERVAIAAGVLGGDQPLLTCDAHDEGAPLLEQRCGECDVVLLCAEVTSEAQLVVQLVGGPRLAPQLPLDLVDRVAVEQVAQFLLPEQLAQQVAVERERLGTPLGRRRVVLVHVGRDVVEEQGGRVRRRALALHLDDVELASLHPLEQRAERRQIEDVLEALAVGLEDHREAAVLPRDLQERLGLQPLLPERRALARTPARDQQRATRVLAETRPEEGGLPDLSDDEVFDLAGIDHQVVGGRRRIRLGEVQGNAVVGPDRLGLDPVRLSQPCCDRHRPRGVNAASERRQDAHAPIADLVAEALDHDRAVGGDNPGCALLLAQERQQVVGGSLVEMELAAEPRRGALVRERRQLAGRRADLLAELVGTADALPFPERNGTRQSRRRRDEHAVARDLLDPPRGCAEQERLSRARLVDHLLVELTDAAAAVDEKDAEEAAIGDRSRIRDREPPGTVARPNHPAGAIPDDARPQLGELVGGVAAGEHVEHVLELLPREILEGICTGDQQMKVVDRDLGVRGDRDDLLREDVQRVPRYPRLLDLALAHRACDHRRLQQVGAELREDPALRRRAQLVPGASDPLQAACDRLGRLDLDHEVDGAHVDAELETRCGDETGDPPRLEILLDDDALLAGQRSVVSASDLLLRELVQPQREPLGQAAVVDEDDRGAMLLDEPQHLRIDRRPDRVRAVLGAAVHLLTVGRHGLREGSGRCELAHVLDRDDHLEIEILARACIHDRDRPTAADEAADLLDRPLGRREADPLDRALGERLAGARRTARDAHRASSLQLRAPRRGSASRRRAATRAPAR